MASKFAPGDIAYAKDGRSYTVEDVDAGIVYCRGSNGAEADFPEAALSTEAEWSARSSGRRDVSYARLKQASVYKAAGVRLDRAAAAQLLAKLQRLSPGLIDFAAFTVASRAMTENGDSDLVGELSIVKCRELFDAATPEVRASLLANLLSTPPAVLVDAARLGDNLMRAMLEKGLAPHTEAFEAFGNRRRR
ncbi:MAG TPA: hypothetical protein VMC10_21185 [Stellaceae bacterium]|nr:hypothetical protein [Stellaceae bacterium]